MGLYSVAQADIAAKNYQKALLSLQAIGSYVNSPEVVTLPAVAQRRSVDLFIVDSLTSLVQGQIEKGSADTTSLVNAAEQIADIRSRGERGGRVPAGGKVADAERLYGQALAVIPEVARATRGSRAVPGCGDPRRQDTLRAGLSRAESAFAAGRFPRCFPAYRDAFVYLPESPARLDRTLSNIGTAGAAQPTRRPRPSNRGQPLPLLTQGNALQKQGQYPDALQQYLSLIQSYPRGPHVLAAVKGINDSVAGLNGRAAADLKAETDQVDALNTQLTA